MLVFFKEFVIVSVLYFVGVYAKDSYRERLTFKDLPNGQRFFNFRFSFERQGVEDSRHYTLFPKVIGQLTSRYGLEELHLSLTQNFWSPRRWGQPPQPAIPVGAQVWAVFDDDKDLDKRWEYLVHTLSGYFCASLTQIVPTLSVNPLSGFRPQGFVSAPTASAKDNSRIRYGTLPGENVCTENLTPWKKLLPCKEVGLSSLLSTPHKLFETHYHSLHVDLYRVCPKGETECRAPSWNLELSLNLIFDAPIDTRKLDWKLNQFFDANIFRGCTITKDSHVLLDITDKKITLTPPQHSIVEEMGRKYAFFNLSSEPKGNFHLKTQYDPPELKISADFRPKILLHAFVAGTGQHQGGLVSQIENRSPETRTVLYTHVIPWYIRIYTHTLTIRNRDTGSILAPSNFHYQPAKDRARPHYLELVLKLPPNTVHFLEMDFEKYFLRWTEYPPDAHRGFTIPGPALTYRILDGDWSDFVVVPSIFDGTLGTPATLHGEALLITMPTPDFSMPYNVICLVCTVIALFFGPVHNLTTKRLQLISQSDFDKMKLRNRITSIISQAKEKLREKFSKKKTE